MMNFLLDPNIAYLILMAGVLFSFLAIVTPGTGMFEIGAGFCILLMGYAAYNLSVNGWAIGIMVLSIVPFVYATQKPKRELYLGLAIVLIVIGSVFMFPSEDALFAVNPFVALLASVLVAGFMWISASKAIEAASARPMYDLNGLVGQVGEARTSVHTEGSVQVSGELWSARSNDLIQVGSSIKVLRREGFILVVENANRPAS